MTKLENVENLFKQAFPKALSYSDVWNTLLVGENSIQRYYKSGGQLMKTLEKKGKVKKITVGYYCWIPN